MVSDNDEPADLAGFRAQSEELKNQRALLGELLGFSTAQMPRTPAG
jgi:hypothetical protein